MSMRVSCLNLPLVPFFFAVSTNSFALLRDVDFVRHAAPCLERSHELCAHKSISSSYISSINFGDEVADEQRRSLLVSSLLLTGTLSAVFVGDNDCDIFGVITGSSSTTEGALVLSSVDQAVNIIESQCDPRYLHAVVASDYKFLYKGIKGGQQQGITIYEKYEEENLLDSDSNIFQALEAQLKDRPLQPSNSFLGVSNAEAAAAMAVGSRQVVSVWPLGQNVHFAWMELGTSFQDSVDFASADDNVIVDGVDCGRMALEDALEDGKEVLFRADRYLSVPLSMEKELVTKLKSAFFI